MNNLIKTYKDLNVWKKSYDLTLQIYKTTKLFPKEETYSLISQIRRAAVSVVSNIAEGAARNSRKEFINFLHIAQGSIAELETQIIISNKLSFIDSSQKQLLLSEIDEISKMIIGLQRSLRAKK